MSLPSTGTRIILNQSGQAHRGTVLYAGPVNVTSGVWLGIEWDDASRGKHSGSHGGREYFSCRVPNSATFLRPTPHLSTGQSLLSALRAKYTAAQADGAPDRVTLGSSDGTIEVEAPRMEKVLRRLGRVEELKEVGLEGVGVWGVGAGEEEELRALGKNVRHLSLTHSLIANLAAVSRIASCLPKLESLDVSFNRFAELDASLGDEGAGLTRLKVLKLNGTLVNWSEIQRLSSSLPSVTHIELSLNALTTLCPSSPAPSLPNIKLLNFSSNSLASWSDIQSTLSALPSLDSLILTSNQITEIPVSGGPWPTLRQLAISSNPIKEWGSVDALHTVLPALENLTLQDCPLLESEAHSRARQLMIARIGSLKVLNSSQITEHERKDAELYYLGQPTSSRPSPRWAELCKRYDIQSDAPSSAPSSAPSNTLQSKLLHLTLHLPAPAEPQPIKVLRTMPLRALRAKLARTAGRKPAEVKLWAVLGHDEGVEKGSLRIEMEDEGKEVGWFGLGQGERIELEIR